MTPPARQASARPDDHSAAPARATDALAWLAVTGASGSLLILIGCVGLLAWASGHPEYIQVEQSVPPLHYNAALGFLLWGGAYLALARGRYAAARTLAVGLAVLGGVLSLTLVPGLGLKLDRWAFTPPPTCPDFPAGGAAPGMCVGLGLAAVAVLLAARREPRVIYGVIGSLIGLALTIGAPAALVFSQSGSFSGRGSGPTVLGAVGAAVAGVGLLASVVRRGVPAFALGHTLPLTVALAGVALTVFLWVGLDREQNRRLHRQVQFEAGHVHRIALDRLRREVESLGALAERLGRTEPEQLKADIGNYVGGQPGCLGVARVTPELEVTWVEGRQNASLPAALTELGVGEPVGVAVRQGVPVVVRPPRSLWRGARVVVIFTPERPTPNSGGLLSVLRLSDLFDTIINPNLSAGYAVRVSDRGEALFGRYDTDEAYRERWGQSLPLGVGGFEWRLSVWPTRDVLARENLSLPVLALLIGLSTTSLLALAVHLAQTARRRARQLEREVRQRECAQHALSKSEQMYRSLIENLGQGIFLQDCEHRFVAANAEFCRGLGRGEGEIVGATEAALFPPQQAAGHAEEVRTVLAEGKRVESEEEVLVGGKRRSIRRVLSPVRDHSGRTEGVLGICWDVTEQRQLESHVHQASKMDAIGQLAGGIAHDFNNLLTVILGNLDILLERFEEGDADRELVVSAQQAAGRAASLTQRLLGFSRRHQLDWLPTSVNGVIDEVVALLRRTIDPLIRLETGLDPDLWPVIADPAQLNQVLMNLCLNARDAIAGAGEIRIETACVLNPDQGEGGVLNSRAGEFVRLRVTDTGSGMTPDVLARMYEPFFTTKEVGKGTGLGLPMVFAIVRQHKGWIDCASEVGRGTRFDIYLPRGEGSKIALPAEAPAEPRRAGKETVLVVDDEELVRRLAAATLEAQGYSVLQAENGQQALDVYAHEGERIDLVILDLTMPIVSGHEAFRHLLQLNPRVNVLFASGYAVEELSDLEKELMAGFVRKPYRPNDLVVAVERALQRIATVPDSHPAEMLPSMSGRFARLPDPARTW